MTLRKRTFGENFDICVNVKAIEFIIMKLFDNRDEELINNIFTPIVELIPKIDKYDKTTAKILYTYELCELLMKINTHPEQCTPDNIKPLLSALTSINKYARDYKVYDIRYELHIRSSDDDPIYYIKPETLAVIFTFINKTPVTIHTIKALYKIMKSRVKSSDDLNNEKRNEILNNMKKFYKLYNSADLLLDELNKKTTIKLNETDLNRLRPIIKKHISRYTHLILWFVFSQGIPITIYEDMYGTKEAKSFVEKIGKTTGIEFMYVINKFAAKHDISDIFSCADTNSKLYKALHYNQRQSIRINNLYEHLFWMLIGIMSYFRRLSIDDTYQEFKESIVGVNMLKYIFSSNEKQENSLFMLLKYTIISTIGWIVECYGIFQYGVNIGDNSLRKLNSGIMMDSLPRILCSTYYNFNITDDKDTIYIKLLNNISYNDNNKYETVTFVCKEPDVYRHELIISKIFNVCDTNIDSRITTLFNKFTTDIGKIVFVRYTLKNKLDYIQILKLIRKLNLYKYLYDSYIWESNQVFIELLIDEDKTNITLTETKNIINYIHSIKDIDCVLKIIALSHLSESTKLELIIYILNNIPRGFLVDRFRNLIEKLSENTPISETDCYNNFGDVYEMLCYF